MKFDKFALIAILTGLIVLVGMKLLVYGSWTALLTGIVTGSVTVFGLMMLIIGLLIMLL